MIGLLQITAALVIAAMAAGSLLNLSRHPHWFIRGWEFPRLQIVVVTTASAAVVLATEWFGRWMSPPAVAATLSVAAATIGWQLVRIGKFTPVYPRSVLRTPKTKRDDYHRVRLVASNVQMDNRAYERWQEVIAAEDPDVVLAVEVDDNWVDATRDFRQRYPHAVIQSQDNYYGMMLLSRLPVHDARVRFLVQRDVPSIHATLELKSGGKIQLRCLHPRPPEPLRDVDSHHRDAELVVVGREIADVEAPAIVCGDLNDVAWSRTTRLFLKVSRMVDPRVGRGLYNTWHARYWPVRLPLDHVFHSSCFTLRHLHRLRYVGSDHFPMLVDLQYTPSYQSEQSAPDKDAEDREEAQEIIEYQRDKHDRPIHSDEA